MELIIAVPVLCQENFDGVLLLIPTFMVEYESKLHSFTSVLN